MRRFSAGVGTRSGPAAVIDLVGLQGCRPSLVADRRHDAVQATHDDHRALTAVGLPASDSLQLREHLVEAAG